MAPQALYPTFRYRDAHAAIDWLEQAFGFERKEVHEGGDGTVVHAELSFRGQLIMLGEAHDASAGGYAAIAPPPGSGSTYVAVDDPDALHDRVVAAGGGEVVSPLHDTDYGSRDFTVRDPGGNIWSFGTYAPEG